MRSDTDPSALYACEVRPEIWAAAERRTDDAGSRLVAYLDDGESTRLELSVRRTGAGDVVVALEDRHINVFLAHSEAALAQQVGTYLTAGGFLRFADEVEVHAAQAPRAERLETDSIWTFTEEVKSTWS
jgi:hypothetical protein